MSIDAMEMEKIAVLARLQIPSAELSQVTGRIASVIDFIDQLHRVDTAAVEPLSHPLDTVQRLRADKVTETDERDRFQKVAPLTEQGLYLVPKVIE